MMVDFSGKLFGVLISGSRWVSVMVGFDVIWLLGWVYGESRWVYGSLWWFVAVCSFGFVTDSGGYMVLVVVLVFLFFVADPVGLCWFCCFGFLVVGVIVVVVLVAVVGRGDGCVVVVIVFQ